MELQEFRERTSPTSVWEPKPEDHANDPDESVERPVEPEPDELPERLPIAGLNGLPEYLAASEPPRRRSAFASDPDHDAENGNGASKDDVADDPCA